MKRTFISRSKLFRNNLLFRTGILTLKRKIQPRRNVIILGYHALKNPEFLKTTLGIGFRDHDFAQQLHYINSRFPVLTMDQFLAGLTGQTSWPDNAVLITFDDGYRDLLETGLPVLKSLGMPATVFISTDSIGTGRSLWPNRLYYYFRQSERADITLKIADDAENTYPLNSIHAKQETALKISGALKMLSPGEREQTLIEIAEALDVNPGLDPHDQMPMLDWDGVRTLRKNNITIGSHTVTHPILSRCSTEELDREITGSKSEIEKQTGTECSVIAYPNGQPGDYNQAVINTVASAGYQAAFTFFSGPVTPQTDPFAIPRHPVFEVPLHTFALSIG